MAKTKWRRPTGKGVSAQELLERATLRNCVHTTRIRYWQLLRGSLERVVKEAVPAPKGVTLDEVKELHEMIGAVCSGRPDNAVESIRTTSNQYRAIVEAGERIDMIIVGLPGE